MRALFALAACLTLAACNADTAEPPAPIEEHSHAGETDHGPSGPAPNPTPEMADEADKAESVAGDGTLIHANFRGQWDFVEGTCAPESDLRLEVQPRAITFYESHGNVVGVDTVDPFAVTLDLAMSGEGEEWDQTLELKLVDANTHLVVIDPANPGAARDLLRKRCL